MPACAKGPGALVRPRLIVPWIITPLTPKVPRNLLLSDDLVGEPAVSFYTALPPEQAGLLKDIRALPQPVAGLRRPARHTRLRRIMRHAFTPYAIEAMRPGIEGIVTHLLDRLGDAARGTARPT